jgi:hypothetical protein
MFLERGKRARTLEEILTGLERGGFDFKAQGWKEKRPTSQLINSACQEPSSNSQTA